ncbi:hypothetical protein [uncultured Bacteroides sp.]|uniref:hypothetical protein n=1 Tax=uncultured Bacteroides sp. TaxID=162156 RepID=UPI0025AF5BFB|nr:hypothetical protein [uncultured Bacteroides sp.]
MVSLADEEDVSSYYDICRLLMIRCFLPPFIYRQNALPVGVPVMKGLPSLSFHPPFRT